MSRPLQKKPTATRAILLMITALAILLGCSSSSKLRRNKTLRDINSGKPFEPLENIFEDKKKKKKVTPASTTAASAPAPAAPEKESFFTVPAGWTLANADPDTQVYQLQHPQHADAKIMISLEAFEPDGSREDTLRQRHKQVVSKLPQSFAQREYREWSVQDRPHIHTSLEGRAAQEKPLMVISGYSVALGDYSCTIFSAFRKEDASLGNDVEQLATSLRPISLVPEPGPLEGDEETPGALDETSKEAPGDAPASSKI